MDKHHYICQETQPRKNMLFRFLNGENIVYHNNNAEKTIQPNIAIRKIIWNLSEKYVYIHKILMISCIS